MGTRLNFARMRSTTGGTGALVLSSVPTRPTFNQSLGSSTGTHINFKYTIIEPATGAFEVGTGTYTADTATLSDRTPIESWSGSGSVGTATLNFGTDVLVYCGVFHQDVTTADEIGSAATADLSDFAPFVHEHTPDEVGIDTTTGAPGHPIVLQSDGSLKAEAMSLASFSTNRIAAETGKFLYGTTQGANTVWSKVGLRTILTALGKDKVGMTFAVPEKTSGAFPIAVYVPEILNGAALTGAYAQTVSGVQQIAIKVNGTTVTGLDAIAMTSTRSQATANTVVVTGDIVSGEIATGTSPVLGAGVLLFTLAGE